jgi:hypothetical protein
VAGHGNAGSVGLGSSLRGRFVRLVRRLTKREPMLAMAILRHHRLARLGRKRADPLGIRLHL